MSSPPELPSFDNVPIYKEFFEEPELFERIHVSLIGINTFDDETGEKAKGISERKSLFGLVSHKPDVSVKVETLGTDTGKCPHFDINSHEFATKEGNQYPIWHKKCVLVTKKAGTESICLTVTDKANNDEEILNFILPRSAITTPYGGEWQNVIATSEQGRMAGVKLLFRLRLTDMTTKIVSQELLESYLQDTPTHKYTEEILPDETSSSDADNALLQCWRSRAGASQKAVLWVLGRNDCFMHPHVIQTLFFDRGFDVFILNYRMDGACRSRGWVDPLMNSHCKGGDFDVYFNEIGKAIDIMKEAKYPITLGYAHSTGGPILLDYLIEKGDSFFDGFIFNSPFMDVPTGEGILETVADLGIDNLGFCKAIGALDDDWFPGDAVPPETIEPIKYMGETIVMSNWSMKLFSQYYFPFHNRPMYNVRYTVGFFDGVNKVHKKVKAIRDNKWAITSKPFVVISSRSDDTLDSNDTMSQVDWIGPGRCEIELKDNAHDVFLSQEEKDNKMALDSVVNWMKAQQFY